MTFADGADDTCPVCGGACQGFPNVPLPSDYPFLREDQMADHPKTDEPATTDEKRPRSRRARARRRDSDRAKTGPVEDREKRHDEDR